MPQYLINHLWFKLFALPDDAVLRHADDDGGSSTEFTVELDRPLMQFDEPFRQGQPKTDSTVFRSEAGINLPKRLQGYRSADMRIPVSSTRNVMR